MRGASQLVVCPFLGQREAKVEQGMVTATDISHEHADLAVVNLPPVPAPLALHAYRMRPAFGKTARIEGDDAIGFAQLLDRLSN
jgi:hypothetical protein